MEDASEPKSPGEMSVAIALKEWQVVTDLLGDGGQILLLRKGGIQEGVNRFEIAHERFALLPTRLHQNADMLKPAYRGRVAAGEDEPASFELKHAGEITDIVAVRDRATMDRLDDLHCWAAPYIDLRFDYRPERPLYLMLVRAYRLAEAFDLRNTFEVAGCKSWVPLPGPLAVAEPALGDGEYERRRAEVLGRLDGG